jgi:hypothetical protein
MGEDAIKCTYTKCTGRKFRKKFIKEGYADDPSGLQKRTHKEANLPSPLFKLWGASG